MHDSMAFFPKLYLFFSKQLSIYLRYIVTFIIIFWLFHKKKGESIILAIENIFQYLQSKSVWNITRCLTLDAIHLLFDFLLQTLNATEKRNMVIDSLMILQASFHKYWLWLRLCQMMNRLTGGHRCLPGASSEEPWSPVCTSTCSSQRAENIWRAVQFAQGTLLQCQSGVRCEKYNRHSPEPLLSNTWGCLHCTGTWQTWGTATRPRNGP